MTDQPESVNAGATPVEQGATASAQRSSSSSSVPAGSSQEGAEAPRESNWAGLPLPPPVTDAEVLAAIRAELWDAMRGRDIGGDRTLVGMVKRLRAERDEARENRRGEFDLRMAAEAALRAVPSPEGAGSPERIETKEHELKTWPEYYAALLDGTKTFEFRRNDRGFQVGDVLWLREWTPERVDGHVVSGAYTGRSMRRSVGYILPLGPDAILSLLPAGAGEAREGASVTREVLDVGAEHARSESGPDAGTEARAQSSDAGSRGAAALPQVRPEDGREGGAVGCVHGSEDLSVVRGVAGLTESAPRVWWEYVGEELAIFWESPYGHGKEKIASFWWPIHPAEATAAVEHAFEGLAERLVTNQVQLPSPCPVCGARWSCAHEAESEGAGSPERIAEIRADLERDIRMFGPSVLSANVEYLLSLVSGAGEALEGAAALRTLIADLVKALKWADGKLSKFVTEDTGNGAFVRGTGTELAGFGLPRAEMRDVIAKAEALLAGIEHDDDDTRRDGRPASGPTGSSRSQPEGSQQ